MSDLICVIVYVFLILGILGLFTALLGMAKSYDRKVSISSNDKQQYRY